jgi:4-methyl-5(b-hydroxyethyl)-thiazole monophosphate biosynthesis
MAKQVLILAFDGVEEIELFAVLDVLKRSGIDPTILSARNSEFITTRSGFRIDYDAYAKFGYMVLEEYDAIYVPGGGIEGAFNELFDEYSDSIIGEIKSAYKHGCIIAADCIAPALLASRGAFDMQKDYQVTSYPGTEKGRIKSEHLAKNLSGKRVHVDRQIITGNGPAAAVELGAELAAALTGRKTAEKALEDMGYDS